MIDIVVEDYSETQKIMFLRNEGKNIWSTFCLLGFEDELGFFGFTINRTKRNNEIGFVFNKSDEEMICVETEKFIIDHNIEKIKGMEH